MANKYKTIFIGIIILIALLSGCSKAGSYSVPISNGVLDLSLDSSGHAGIAPLNGGWQFYWNKFVLYDDLSVQKPDLTADVPNSWKSYALNGKELDGKGYATYRLHVETKNPKGTLMAVKMSTFSSAYELYIDDQLIASNGVTGTVKSEEIPEYRPLVAAFSTPSNDFDIIIHVSNFHYANGGFWNPVYIGNINVMTQYQDKATRYESMLLGALLVVALFFYAVFMLNKEFKYALYFAWTCMSLLILTDMVGEMSIAGMLGLLNFNQTIWLWNSSILWLLVSLNLYLHELFPSGYSRMSLKLLAGYFIVVQSIYTFASPEFFGSFAIVTNYLEITWLSNLLVIVMIGIWNKQKGGLLNLISLIVALVSYTYDVLSYANQIRVEIPQTKLFGILFFIFIQMIIQAGRIKTYQEQVVTSELAFLQSQIKPHFLHNALNVIISISRYDTEKSRELLVEFSNYLRRSFDFKDFSHFAVLRNEMEHVKSYVAIEMARFDERVHVSFDLLEQQDYKVPMLMLQPIVENAIVHGLLARPEGGNVDVSVKKAGRFLEFSVKDNGAGFDASTILHSKSGDVRKGVGLLNIDSRLKKMYGKGLGIVSDKGKGTEVKWTVPVKGLVPVKGTGTIKGTGTVNGMVPVKRRERK